MTPGQLVKAVAIALDVPEETVTQHDRNLVVAGLRTKGGRGRSAPEVTPLDAARLLVATLGSVRAKDSVATVNVFEQTVFDPPKSMAEYVADYQKRGLAVPPGTEHEIHDTAKFDDQAISVLPNEHNFVQAIASLVSDASLPIGDLDQYLQRFSELIVQCESGFTIAARIGRLGRAGLGSARYERRAIGTTKAAKPSSEPRHRPYARLYGIRQKRDVSGSAIMMLGMAFRDGGLPFKTTLEALDALLGTKKARRNPRRSPDVQAASPRFYPTGPVTSPFRFKARRSSGLAGDL